MLGKYADAFFLGHMNERVVASQPNQFGSSYRVPDRERLAGMGDLGWRSPFKAAAAAIKQVAAPALTPTQAVLSKWGAIKQVSSQVATPAPAVVEQVTAAQVAVDPRLDKYRSLLKSINAQTSSIDGYCPAIHGLGADPVTSVTVPVPAAAGGWLSSVASFLNPVAAPPANTPGGTVAPAPSKLPLYLALAGGALALFFVFKAK